MNLLGLIILSLAMGLLAWLAFYWSVKSGQYEDPEGPKYRMLEDDDGAPAGPPAPPPPAGAAAPPVIPAQPPEAPPAPSAPAGPPKRP